MVRPVRFRVAGGLLAFSGENGPGGCALFGLWITHQGEDVRWGCPGKRSRWLDGVCGRALLEVVRKPSPCLKHHEPLPVGRAYSELGTVRFRCRGRDRSSRKRGQALFRQLLLQAYGRGLGLPKPGICPRHGGNLERAWDDRFFLADAQAQRIEFWKENQLKEK